MGVCLNPGNEKFKMDINAEIYVDKSELIACTNKVINTPQRFVCVSRPRRFGKSMAANMLIAYYSRGCDSESLFQGLKLAQKQDFQKNLNKYDVIFLNMQEFLSRSKDIHEMINRINQLVMRDFKKEYRNVDYFDDTDLIQSMADVYEARKCPFVVVIDEWDCVFREYRTDREAQEIYLDFLRDFLKDKGYISLAYMTGILPIKKYGTHSALNMFDEFSMTNPRQFAEYVGFTEAEVKTICDKYALSAEEMKEWYDGYHFRQSQSIYSPKSVVTAALAGVCDTYWNQTENFEALRFYIDMNFEGLKDDVLRMMAGEAIVINIGSFSNDMTTFHSEADVLALLIHLGYLGYDFDNQCVFIPNHEVKREFVNAVSTADWGEVSKALKNSADTLQAIWTNRPKQVAKGIEQAHFETAHIQYNDENALSYTISLALYAARNFYTVIRELPTGKGFADMVYIPRKKFKEKPALIIELKWDKSAHGAISQIKEKQYCKSLEEYEGAILLVGINYDKATKKHECIIEQITKF